MSKSQSNPEIIKKLGFAHNPSPYVQPLLFGDSLTEQSHKDACDLNIIVARAQHNPAVLLDKSLRPIYFICACLLIVVSNTYCVVSLYCLSLSRVPNVAIFSGSLTFMYLINNVSAETKTTWSMISTATNNPPAKVSTK